MTESIDPTPTNEPKADETFTWTNEAPPSDEAKTAGTSTPASILDSVRDLVDELTERAAPTVRELSARAAELTAIAADRAAPLAKRAGEVTADASATLASKSREWASDLRASVATAEREMGQDAPAVQPATPAAEPIDGASTTEQPGLD